MSDDLLARAASQDKPMHLIEGTNHMSLYDKQPYVDEAEAASTPSTQPSPTIECGLSAGLGGGRQIASS